MPSSICTPRLRMPLPAVLVPVALPRSVIAQVRAVVGDRTRLYPVERVPDAVPHLERHMGSCLLVAVPGEEQTALVAELLQLRALYPHVPAVALFLPPISSHRSTLHLGSAGITEIVVADPAVIADDLLVSLTRCHADGVAVQVWRYCALDIPEALVPVLKTAIRLAHEPLTAVRLAAAAGMHERSLRKYCEHEGLPSPQWVIGWARLLLAGYYLDEPGRTIASVAELLGFPSTCALRNQLRRYSTVAPSILRARGAPRTLARLLEQSVREQRSATAANAAKTGQPRQLRLVR